jgi:cytosine/adenosine deaminase-related metal-dependent hydrolase
MASRLLITGGAVISVDPSIGDLRKGDVLIDGDTIVEVGPSIDASDCETIDATGMIVMPGLVDSHRHFWQTGTRSDSVDQVFWDLVASQWPKIAAHYAAEDVYAAVIAGAADAVDAGVTTVLDWCHVVNTHEHAEENLRALREVGIRSLFLYGASMSRKLQEYEGQTEHEDSWAPARRMYESEFSGNGGLITFGLAIQGPDVTTMEITADDLKAARELGVPVGIHIGAPEGGDPHYSMKRMHEAGLLGPDINFSHCCNNTDEELRMVVDSGGKLVACPTLDVMFGMGNPVTGRVRDAGARPALGVDSVIAASGSMFDEMRAALLYERMKNAQRVYDAEKRDVKSVDELRFTTREALEAATIGSAGAMWLDDKIGSLTPGKQADVILLRATDLNLTPASDLVGAVVTSGHNGNVDTVLIAGKVMKRGGKLTTIDTKRVNTLITEARDRLYGYDDYDGMRPPVAVAGATA